MSASFLPRHTQSARWLMPATNDDAAQALCKALGVELLCGRVLVQRGLIDQTSATEFLRPGLSALHDPLRMKDMDFAVDRLWRAIRDREPILLYGDYDVDGTASIVILKTALELLGAQAQFHVPHRLSEGYGMRSEIIEQAACSGVKLIVSVDTGIRAKDVVRQALTLGIDVIITDHHLPEAELPPALAVLNPNRADCPYPEKGLCGAGVSFKLVQALFERSGFAAERRARLLDSFLKLVAVATIADIVPLTGENRVMVGRGLAGLRSVRNPGLRALIGVSGVSDGIAPSSHEVAFRIAPRINAAGRMASARDVIDLFLTSDEDRARALAQQLDSLNRERQQAESEIVETILDQCSQQDFEIDSAAFVFAEPGWHLGVVGIVASRLVERFSRPVFVLSDAAEDGVLSGSGRSIPAFNLLEALESMKDLFHKFGGHRQAAGLTIRRERLQEFREHFEKHARGRLTSEDMRPQFAVDAVASFKELTSRSINQIFELAPFGFGNPTPLFVTERVEIAAQARAFSNGRHLTVPLRHHGRTLFFKAWNFGDCFDRFGRGQIIDILFSIDEDNGSRARGLDGWSLCLRDVRVPGEPSDRI
jgi:single-stranded-DNA-specific exonuclease